MIDQHLSRKFRCYSVSAITVAIALSVSTSPLFAGTPLPGEWVCVGQGAFGDIRDTPGNQGFTFTIHELLQLVTGRKGNVKSGTLIYSAGEACNLTVAAGSTYNVNASDGSGVIDLKLNVPKEDEDNDFDCSLIFGASPTVEFDIVLTSGGQQFYFTGADDYVTSLDNDVGDFVPISGQCVKK